MKKLWLGILILIIAAGIILVALQSLPNRPTQKGTTLSQIKAVYAILQMSEIEENDLITYLHDKHFSKERISIILNAWISRGGATIDPLLETNKEAKKLKDGWGHELEVCWKDQLPTNIPISAKLTNSNTKLIIFSTGKNGSNEWGFGDDVFLKEIPVFHVDK